MARHFTVSPCQYCTLQTFRSSSKQFMQPLRLLEVTYFFKKEFNLMPSLRVPFRLLTLTRYICCAIKRCLGAPSPFWAFWQASNSSDVWVVARLSLKWPGYDNMWFCWGYHMQFYGFLALALVFMGVAQPKDSTGSLNLFWIFVPLYSFPRRKFEVSVLTKFWPKPSAMSQLIVLGLVPPNCTGQTAMEVLFRG